MSAPSRRPEIRRRQTRKEKIRKLRRRYTEARTDAERQKLYLKAKVLSPLLKLGEFTKLPVDQASA